MSVATIKEEVISEFARKIENIKDEASLNVILEFLNGIGETQTNNTDLSKHYEGIKQKYSSVLAKLAQ